MILKVVKLFNLALRIMWIPFSTKISGGRSLSLKGWVDYTFVELMRGHMRLVISLNKVLLYQSLDFEKVVSFIQISFPIQVKWVNGDL